MIKNPATVFFYAFIIVFVTLAYLYNNNMLSFIPKDSEETNKIQTAEKFKEKKYNLSFPKSFNNQVLEIASFEKDEKWSGRYEYDDSNYLEGKSSLVLNSNRNRLTTIETKKSLNLQNLNLIKLMVYSDNEENSDNVISLNVILVSNKTNLEYEVTKIAPGWNTIKIFKSDFLSSENLSSASAGWNKIEKLKFELVSRMNTKTELLLDRMWTEQSEAYQKDWSSNNADFISLKKFNGNTYLNLWGIKGASTFLSKITYVSNFDYLVKLIPQKKGIFGVSFKTDSNTGYGYFLEFGGIEKNNWSLYKVSKPNITNSLVTNLDNGIFSNFYIKRDVPFWIKISAESGRTKCFYSFDGITYYKMTEKADDEIKAGGFGFISKGGGFLLESIAFSQ